MGSIETRIITEYSDEIAQGIGALRPDLSDRFEARPMDRQQLEEIIASPYHDQLVAQMQGKIVGAGTMSLILGGISEGRKAWLEDFVSSSSEEVRGQGIGYAVWLRLLDWAESKNATVLEFTSNPKKVDAHTFYFRQGVKIRETDVLELPLT